MLRVALLSRRITSQLCVSLNCSSFRCLSDDAGPKTERNRQWKAQRKERQRQEKRGQAAGEVKDRDTPKSSQDAKKSSLIEQLFPEETKRYEAYRAKPEREIPRLPLDTSSALQRVKRQDDTKPQSTYERHLQQAMHNAGPQTSILVLRNASKNLTLQDFRRLIPQGKHMEGWTLERGDIIKVIPGRNLATLEQQNYYYLLFSSALSAFAYQGHATRIHRMAASHSPGSLLGPIPPPPGFMVDGMDAHDAISAYTLTSPHQSLQLRQLKPPLSPLLDSLIHHEGYASIANRPNKMPFELRLTLEGPQLQLSKIKHILDESGRDRALSWSGSQDSIVPVISRWEPLPSPSPQNMSSWAAKQVNRRTEDEQLRRDLAKSQGPSAGSDSLNRRMPGLVYVLGFQTESAAQSFKAHWHGRPMEWRKGHGRGAVEDEWEEIEDAAPTATVEILW